MTVSSDSIEQHLCSLSANGLSANTTKAYRADLQSWLLWLNEFGGIPLTFQELETTSGKYLNEKRLTWTPRTLRRHLASIRGWAKAQGYPMFLSKYRPPTAAPAEPHPVPDGFDAIHRLIAVARNDRERALFALCGFCGLRVAEAVSIRRESVDLGRRTLKVEGKGSKQRIVPISDRAMLYLTPATLNALPGETLVGLTNNSARKYISYLGRRIGIPLASHDLRSTFATQVYAATKDIAAVQVLLGHANVDTTRAYIAVTEDTLRRAVNAS